MAVDIDVVIENSVKVIRETETRCGLSIADLVGETVNGVYSAPPNTCVFDGTGIQRIAERGFYDFHSYGQRIVGADFDNVEYVERDGLRYAFNNSILQWLKIGKKLRVVEYYGMGYVAQNTDIGGEYHFDVLERVDDFGFQYAFVGTKITKVYFPALEVVGVNAFYNAWRSCNELTEIHFRADMESVVRGLSGFSNKFGATNAQIIFDL